MLCSIGGLTRIAIFLGSISLAWFSLPANALNKSEFDHFSTGFPITGQHVGMECEACHVKGVFKGTPILCAGCHNGSTALGKTLQHIPTNEVCDDCHTTFGWGRVVMDHSAVASECKSCHAPYPVGHVPTVGPCDDCHISLAWESIRFTHSGILSGCRSCHAELLQPTHPPISVSDDCDLCHNTQTWQGARFNHSTINVPCSTCHAGDKPADHIPTTEECGFCHSTQAWPGATNGL